MYKKLRTALTTLIAFFALSGVAFAAQCAGGGTGLCNPVGFPDIASFIAGALRVLVMVALPIVTLFIVYSGFKFISAGGNSSELEKAKKNFMYVIIGTLLILGAWVIATLIAGTVSQLTA